MLLCWRARWSTRRLKIQSLPPQVWAAARSRWKRSFTRAALHRSRWKIIHDLLQIYWCQVFIPRFHFHCWKVTKQQNAVKMWIYVLLTKLRQWWRNPRAPMENRCLFCSSKTWQRQHFENQTAGYWVHFFVSKRGRSWHRKSHLRSPFTSCASPTQSCVTKSSFAAGSGPDSCYIWHFLGFLLTSVPAVRRTSALPEELQ